MKTSLEIAQEAVLQPIEQIAERAGLEPDEIEAYGRYKAKVSLSALDRLKDVTDGKLVVVTGMTPTRAGEGKTTTLVGLTQGLGVIGGCAYSESSVEAAAVLDIEPAAASKRYGRALLRLRQALSEAGLTDPEP